jgi:hypothetical protein
MPAVTVEDILVLPRVPEPGPAASAERPVRAVTTAPTGYEGEGFPVRRAFAGVDLKQLDPFVHMDQMGEVDYAPGEPKGDHQRRHAVDDGGGLLQQAPPAQAADPSFGTIGPRRAITIEGAYFAAWLHATLRLSGMAFFADYAYAAAQLVARVTGGFQLAFALLAAA